MSTKTSKLVPPATEVEVNQYITTLAEAATAADKAATKANEKIQRIKADLAADLAEFETVIERHSVALFTYFEKHRDKLHDGQQRLVFTTGTLGQRWSTRTMIKNETAVKQFVVANEMSEFFLAKINLLRNAMLANQAVARKIPGVKFVRERIIYLWYEKYSLEVQLKKKVEVAA